MLNEVNPGKHNKNNDINKDLTQQVSPYQYPLDSCRCNDKVQVTQTVKDGIDN
jgi:hypothetical protein